MSEHRGKHLLSQRRERREASCAMIHHRPTCETPRVDLIWRLPQTYKLSKSQLDWGEQKQRPYVRVEGCGEINLTGCLTCAELRRSWEKAGLVGGSQSQSSAVNFMLNLEWLHVTLDAETGTKNSSVTSTHVSFFIKSQGKYFQGLITDDALAIERLHMFLALIPVC